MKLACQEGLVPGNTFAGKLAKLEHYGFEGVELSGAALFAPGGFEERRDALKDSPIKASSICGGFSCETVHPNPRNRATCIDAIKRLMTMAAALGAVGPISVPIFNRMDRVPDLAPYRSQHQLEKELLIHLLDDIGRYGEEVGACLILEPLNRYESNALADIEEGAEVCRAVGSPGVKLMADFFHMHIEQPDIPASLRKVGDVLVHCHLADSTRKQPGSGSIDFRSGFAALKEIGFKGYMALECGLTGPADEVLPKSVQYLKECVDGAFCS